MSAIYENLKFWVLLLMSEEMSFFDDFVRAGFKDARQLFIAQAVPSHGLDRLSDLLTTCGWRAFDGTQYQFLGHYR